jgi:hypothetical protein
MTSESTPFQLHMYLEKLEVPWGVSAVQFFVSYLPQFLTHSTDLEDHIVVGAIHDSDERCDAPTCFPETRVAVQEDTVGWITQRDQSDLPRQLMTSRVRQDGRRRIRRRDVPR